MCFLFLFLNDNIILTALALQLSAGFLFCFGVVLFVFLCFCFTPISLPLAPHLVRLNLGAQKARFTYITCTHSSCSNRVLSVLITTCPASLVGQVGQWEWAVLSPFCVDHLSWLVITCPASPVGQVGQWESAVLSPFCVSHLSWLVTTCPSCLTSWPGGAVGVSCTQYFLC